MRKTEKNKRSSLPITFSIVNTVDTKDTRFLNVTIDVLHTGVNYNGSIFNKDVVDNNIDSIKNTPILGYIKMEDGTGNPDDFQAHEYNLVINDETGTYQYVYAGHSFGVIPESCNPRWVTKVSSDGQTRDYLEVDGLLWTKFDKAIDIFKRDKVKGQSMELEPETMEGIENQDGTFTFTNFKFDGCCILSTTDANIQPAMIDSNVTANFSKSLAQEIKEKLNEYQLAINLNNINFSKKGSEGSLDKKAEILKKYSLKIKDLNFKIEDIPDNEFEDKIKNFIALKNTKGNFSATYNQKRDALRNTLDSDVVRDKDENVISETYYYVMDFDDTYVYIEKDSWDNEGNFNEIHGRYTYTFDENTLIATLTSDFEEMILMWLTKDEKATIDTERGNYSKLQTEFDEYKKNYKTPEKDVDELRTYKADKTAAEHQAQIDAIFAKSDFESLKDNKEFIDFKDNVGDISLEDIENKCYAILGKVTAKSKANFSVKKPNENSSVVVKVDTTSSSDSAPYGGLFDEYKDK